MGDPFARLEELSSRLNASSDTVNQAIKRVESKLASLRIGVEAFVHEPLETEDVFTDDGKLVGSEERRLGYAKNKGAWSLVVLRYLEVRDDPSEPRYTPLQQASRELRIKAIYQIPALLDELVRSAEATLKDIEKARAVAESIQVPSVD